MNFDACGHCSRCLYLNWVSEITLRENGHIQRRAYCLLCWAVRFGNLTAEQIGAQQFDRIGPRMERSGGVGDIDAAKAFP